MPSLGEEYPEHARLVAIPDGERVAVRRFAEWLLAQPTGYHVRIGRAVRVDPDELTGLGEAEYYEQFVRLARHEFLRVERLSVEDLLVLFYGIDPVKLAAEKARMAEVVAEARRGTAMAVRPPGG